MTGILAELLRNGQESGRTTQIRFERRERITAGEKERRRMRCQLPAPFEKEARDDILGGIPTMAIAGLLLTSSFQEEAITPSQMPSVQNCTWAKQRPERQGDPEEVRKSLTQRCKEIIAKRKKVRRPSHSKGREGIRRRRRGSGAPTRPDWVGADAPGAWSARL